MEISKNVKPEGQTRIFAQAIGSVVSRRNGSSRAPAVKRQVDRSRSRSPEPRRPRHECSPIRERSSEPPFPASSTSSRDVFSRLGTSNNRRQVNLITNEKPEGEEKEEK